MMANNDVTIFAGIFTAMVLIAFLMPTIQEEFFQEITDSELESHMQTLTSGMAGEIHVFNPQTWTGKLTISKSLIRMFLWTYDFFPPWLYWLFLITKLLFYFLVYRAIRSGGG